MVETFDIFYNKLKERVVNLIKDKEIKEGNLNIGYLINDILKQMIIKDLGIKRKVLKSPTKDFVDTNVLYRDDSKDELKIKGHSSVNDIKNDI